MTAKTIQRMLFLWFAMAPVIVVFDGTGNLGLDRYYFPEIWFLFGVIISFPMLLKPCPDCGNFLFWVGPFVNPFATKCTKCGYRINEK